MITTDFYREKNPLLQNKQAFNNYFGLVKMYHYVSDRANLCYFHEPKTTDEQRVIDEINKILEEIKPSYIFAVKMCIAFKNCCKKRTANEYYKNMYETLKSFCLKNKKEDD